MYREYEFINRVFPVSAKDGVFVHELIKAIKDIDKRGICIFRVI